jgi:UDP-N-acetylmuramate--alanine ligase
MGIGGSGMSAVAALASKNGYTVDGCDLAEDTPYTAKIKNEIDIKVGHDKKHLEGKDILLITPAVYFKEPKPDELLSAKNSMTWQEFLGKHLMDGKKVIAVAGTHGKSTTTAMLSLVFENAGKDPSVMVGAKIPNWESNFRFGKSEEFIVEADEFYNSFQNYKPEAIILNNIEFDHPDFFSNEEEVVDSFRKFIGNLNGKKILIYNKDSEKLDKLVSKIGGDIKKYSYSIIDEKADAFGKILGKSEKGTEFKVVSKKLNLDNEFRINVAGEYNVSNALGVISMSSLYSIEPPDIQRGLNEFRGIGRRLELIGERGGVKFYDDYAHHPTAIRETLKALKQMHKDGSIFAVIEPHSYSRTKALIDGYNGVFDEADDVIIAPIFTARDTETFGISEESIVDAAEHKNIKALKSTNDIKDYIKDNTKKGDVVVVMGAGKSYEIARKLLT